MGWVVSRNSAPVGADALFRLIAEISVVAPPPFPPPGALKS